MADEFVRGFDYRMDNDFADFGLGYLLQGISELLEFYGQRLMAAEGFGDIRPAHYQVFDNLQKQGMILSDLAETAGISKQSMAYLVDSLNELGYVKIEKDKSDRRVRRVKFTRKGAKARCTLERSRVLVEYTVMQAVGEEDFAEFWGQGVRVFELLLLGR